MSNFDCGFIQGFSGSDPEEDVYDEDITAQMQNAIDDLLKLNGCDEGPPQAARAVTAASTTNVSPSGGFILNNDTTYSMRNGLSDQFNSGAEMQVDLALNEAVNSILWGFFKTLRFFGILYQFDWGSDVLPLYHFNNSNVLII